jgi:hypothetical protein
MYPAHAVCRNAAHTRRVRKTAHGVCLIHWAAAGGIITLDLYSCLDLNVQEIWWGGRRQEEGGHGNTNSR